MYENKGKNKAFMWTLVHSYLDQDYEDIVITNKAAYELYREHHSTRPQYPLDTQQEGAVRTYLGYLAYVGLLKRTKPGVYVWNLDEHKKKLLEDPLITENFTPKQIEMYCQEGEHGDGIWLWLFFDTVKALWFDMRLFWDNYITTYGEQWTENNTDT